MLGEADDGRADEPAEGAYTIDQSDAAGRSRASQRGAWYGPEHGVGGVCPDGCQPDAEEGDRKISRQRRQRQSQCPDAGGQNHVPAALASAIRTARVGEHCAYRGQVGHGG